MSAASMMFMFDSALRALIAGGLLLLALNALRVRNVLAQKMAWSIALVAALAMPLLIRWQVLPALTTIRIPASAFVRSLPQSSTAVAAPAGEMPAVEASIEKATEEDATNLPVRTIPELNQRGRNYAGATAAHAAMATPTKKAHRGSFSVSMLLRLITPIYLGVSVLLLLRLTLGLFAALRLWHHAKPISHTMSAARDDLDIRWSRRIASPVNIGTGVLLPADYVDWDDEKLCIVLEHEESHVKQRDFYWQLLAGLYAAITWFSPLGWWMKRKLAHLGESISDHAAMRVAVNPEAYAKLLLEFAAMPRPTVSGVAMAHPSNLSQRIDRLLGDATNHSVFTLNRRALVAGALVPVLLLTTAAFVHVRAAEEPKSAALAAATPKLLAAELGVGTLKEALVAANGRQAPMAAAEPKPEARPTQSAAPAAAPEAADSAIVIPAVPAAPVVVVPPIPPIHVDVHMPEMSWMGWMGYDGDPVAIVGDPGTKTRFSGRWDVDRNEAIDQGRQIAKGHFLLFRRNGTTYIIDDAATMAQVEAMNKSMDDLGTQMKEMSKQMRELSEPMREEARKQRESTQNVPVPDIANEMAELNAAVAALKNAQGGTITREQLSEIQRKVSRLQQRLISTQIKVDMSAFNESMAKFSAQEGEIGAQMGELGAQMGQTAHENQEKLQNILDQSLKNGTAHPLK